jgi:uncharacterized SAM-binding protein YcdF (DUF218 family)
MEEDKKLGGFVRRRTLWLPTWRGWLLMLVLVIALVELLARTIHPFLAVNKPVIGGLLVVEGWAPDYAFAAAKSEFERHHYDKIYVTGGPLQWGAPLSAYKTYAELGAAVLIKWGLSTNEVQAVAAPSVRQDRTYTAAATLASWLREHGVVPTKIHLISEGPHARRSWLMCRKAFGPGVTVGITAVPVEGYDPRQWWRFSGGVRGVVDETVAYLYARFLFRPAQPQVTTDGH